MSEAKQAQRVLLKGKKLLGVEQVQSVVIHDAETFDDHVEELYHQSKLLGQPVIPTLCTKLFDLAIEVEPTRTEAARVLGISRKMLRNRERGSWRIGELPERGEEP